MRLGLVATVFLGMVLPLVSSASAKGFDHEHGKWTKVLDGYLTDKGLVRYKALKKDVKKKSDHPFSQYLKEIQDVKAKQYKGWDDNQKKAFLINSYNALTVKLIVDHYPVESIKDIGGFFGKPWDVEFFKLLGGKIETLDPIEHDYLRPNFKDYRIHAAVNCASISCPPLRDEAFVAAKLDEQLDDQMNQWLGDSSRNRYIPQKGVLKVSKIFDWYGDDFEEWGPGIKGVVKKYGPEEAKKAVKKKGEVVFLDYDWGLNEAK